MQRRDSIVDSGRESTIVYNNYIIFYNIIYPN